jgi:hypothetical protein
MSKFTHNLKILIIDSKDEIVEDEELLTKIKERLADSYTHSIFTPPNTQHPWVITVKWELHPLTKLQSHFMGDLFSQPNYSLDSVIYEHTEKTLKQLEKEFKMSNKIRFHISRMPGDNHSLKGQFGLDA